MRPCGCAFPTISSPPAEPGSASSQPATCAKARCGPDAIAERLAKHARRARRAASVSTARAGASRSRCSRRRLHQRCLRWPGLLRGFERPRQRGRGGSPPRRRQRHEHTVGPAQRNHLGSSLPGERPAIRSEQRAVVRDERPERRDTHTIRHRGYARRRGARSGARPGRRWQRHAVVRLFDPLNDQSISGAMLVGIPTMLEDTTHAG